MKDLAMNSHRRVEIGGDLFFFRKISGLHGFALHFFCHMVQLIEIVSLCARFSTLFAVQAAVFFRFLYIYAENERQKEGTDRKLGPEEKEV